MNTYELIKELAKSKRISIAELERKLNLSNGSISKWTKSEPNSKPLQLVADFFEVSTDYLLGRTDIPRIATDDNMLEIDLKKDAAESFFYDGHELNDEDLDLIASILETRIKNRK